MTKFPLATFLAVAVVALSGCSLRQPTPEEVLTKFALRLSDLNSFNFDMDLKLNGNIPTSFAGNLSQASFDLAGGVQATPEGTADFTLNSYVTGKAPNGEVKLAGNLISHSDYTYFQLRDVLLPTLTPLSLGADSRWYKVRRQNGESQAPQISETQMKAAKKEIAEAQIFEVKEVLPISTVSGQRSYHYKVQISSDGLNVLVKNLNSLLNLEIPELESKTIERYQGEVWIGVKDQRLMRLRVADFTTHKDQPIAFDLDVVLSNHNQKLQITPPSASENVDQSRLFGLPKLPF